MSQLIYKDAHRQDEVLIRMLREVNISQQSQPEGPPPSAISASPPPRAINLPTAAPSMVSRKSLAYPHSLDTWTEYNQPRPQPAASSGTVAAVPESLPSTVVASSPPRDLPSVVPTSTATQVYSISSPLETGVTTEWSRAAHATQGVPGGHVKKITALSGIKTSRRGNQARYPVYVVFEGLTPGIYTVWEECNRQVHGVSCNVYLGFNSRREAERAYILAYALGCVRAIPRRLGLGQPRIPAAPMPEALIQSFANAPEDFLEADWHVVYKGKKPGVYPAWNFAASQVLNVRCAAFEHFNTKQEAFDAFDDAVRNGRVQAL